MNAPAPARYPAIRTPLVTLLRGFRVLSDLKTVLRSSPRHSNDEQNAIRGLASLHPAIPRKVTRLRARFVDRDAAGSAAAAGPEDSLFSEQEVQRCLAALKEDGVYIFSQRLSQPMVASLKSALATVPACSTSMKTIS